MNIIITLICLYLFSMMMLMIMVMTDEYKTSYCILLFNIILLCSHYLRAPGKNGLNDMVHLQTINHQFSGQISFSLRFMNHVVHIPCMHLCFPFPMDPFTFQRQHKLQTKHPQVFSSNHQPTTKWNRW